MSELRRITPQDFVARWRQSTLTERSSSQSHFIELCHILGQQTPTEADPTGSWYTFERGAEKTQGGQGWADVWRRGCFAWEYKGKHKDLIKAYEQLLQYREALENPPLLIVSDIDSIEVHTNFTNTVKQIYRFTLDDLLDARKLDHLRRIFTEPDTFRTAPTTASVTEAAAREFAKLADILRNQGEDPRRAARYLIRLLFCLFAEDVGLLPNNAFAKLVRAFKDDPSQFTQSIRELFAAMSTGGNFGYERIPYFDGRLFDDADAPPLSRNGLDVLNVASELDWSAVEPAIFGTLFERSLDPSKRAQLGAHYTSRDDILLIVEPVLMAPLRRQWDEVRAEALSMAARRDALKGGQRTKIDGEIRALLIRFANEIANVQVLDPASGSGNFLYVSLILLLDLQKEVRNFMGDLGITPFFPSVTPEQLHGIEIDAYAHELAQVTIWIGYIQWLRENGFGRPSEPILKPIDTIIQMDAILAFDEDGKPIEPVWPEADVVIGNPPFLGTKRLRRQLGHHYVESLFSLYGARIPNFSDLVCYWLERARDLIERGSVRRAGLIATNSIRNGENRRVLERILSTGGIFMAWSDRPWILDGASVRISVIGFDNGNDQERVLDGVHVKEIYADLTSSVDLTAAVVLAENENLAFIADVKGGAFDIAGEVAHGLLRQIGNPNGRPNSDVVRPWINALDVVQRPRGMWIIDFPSSMTLEDASQYVAPFEYVREHVLPTRSQKRETRTAEKWWIHTRPVDGMRNAVANLSRFICTPAVSKHRLFAWVSHPILPDHRLVVFARSDDYFFGLLQSRAHELWSLRLGPTLEDRPSYTPTTCFVTFPFPWPPGQEPSDDSRTRTIADTARDLVEKRDRWLNPDGADKTELKKRTLTNLYNQRPTWLDLAHKKLDAAVLAAYGWPADLTDEEMLERLLTLNVDRAQTWRPTQQAETL